MIWLGLSEAQVKIGALVLRALVLQRPVSVALSFSQTHGAHTHKYITQLRNSLKLTNYVVVYFAFCFSSNQGMPVWAQSQNSQFQISCVFQSSSLSLQLQCGKWQIGNEQCKLQNQTQNAASSILVHFAASRVCPNYFCSLRVPAPQRWSICV